MFKSSDQYLKWIVQKIIGLGLIVLFIDVVFDFGVRFSCSYIFIAISQIRWNVCVQFIDHCPY